MEPEYPLVRQEESWKELSFGNSIQILITQKLGAEFVFGFETLVRLGFLDTLLLFRCSCDRRFARVGVSLFLNLIFLPLFILVSIRFLIHVCQIQSLF